MDRNTFTGLFLIMVILGAAVFFMKPSEADIKKEKERITADSLKKVGASKASTPTPAVTPNSIAKQDTAISNGPFGANLNGTEATTILENQLIKLTFTNVGGKIKSVEVKNEKTYNGKPVVLFDGTENKFGLNINIDGKIVNTNNLYFTSTKNGNSISMRANYSAEKYIEFVYDLKDASS
ncbi:MAG: membrane protein insertase YidC, partial [Pedobacter sp.]